MSARFVYINDQLLPETEACLFTNDLSVQRGYGIFDYLTVMGTTPLFLAEHLDRLSYSAAQMHLPLPVSRSLLQQRIEKLLTTNNLSYSGVRITLTGGYSPDGYSITTPNLIITQQPLKQPGETSFAKGIALITHPHQRQLPHVKTIDYLMAIWLQPLLKEIGGEDVLYHNNGMVTECPRANFFMVTANNVLVTPAHNILKGITRTKLLELAAAHYKIEVRDIELPELAAAREAFICSTTKHLLPVRSIDGKPVQDGSAGHVTRHLNTLFEAVKFADKTAQPTAAKK